MKSLKKNLIFLILISLIVIYIVFSYDFERTIEVLKTSKLIYIILGALVILIGDLLKGRSIYLLVSEYSSKYKFKDAFRLTLQTNFFNGITPFSLGGQPFQLYLLKKRNNIDYATGSNILFKDFYCYQIGFVFISIVFFIFNLIFKFFVADAFMGKLILVGFIINFVIALFLIYLPYTKGNYNGVLLFSINVLSRLRLIKEKQKVLDNMNEGIKKFKSQIDEVKSNIGLVLKCSLLNILKTCGMGVVAYLSFKSIDVNISIYMSVILVLFVYNMSSFVPVPGASGGVEYGFISVFTSFLLGDVGILVSVAMIIWRFLTYYMPLIVGGVLFAVESRKLV